jgi:hypothetical protein
MNDCFDRRGLDLFSRLDSNSSFHGVVDLFSRLDCMDAGVSRELERKRPILTHPSMDSAFTFVGNSHAVRSNCSDNRL